MTKSRFLASILVVLAFCSLSFSQTVLTNTTLAAAVGSSSTTVVNVSSATGINAPSTSDYTKATYLYVDRELMDVRAVSGTIITVIRGAHGTTAAAHASGALLFVLPAYLSINMDKIPQGSCTRGNLQALPHIHAASGAISDCVGGQWINGDASQTQRAVFGSSSVFGLRLPDPGATALTALETAGTAPGAATEEYCTELDVPFSMLATGLGVLNGTTVGTDNHLVILRDASGIPLANSATAGAVSAGASTYQHYNFTAKYYVVGPARYFGCTQSNGTTDTLRHAITAVNNNVIAGKLTSQTFGTIAAAPTMPTTFTTALGPYYQIY
jgi:hypothetical protein